MRLIQQWLHLQTTYILLREHMKQKTNEQKKNWHPNYTLLTHSYHHCKLFCAAGLFFVVDALFHSFRHILWIQNCKWKALPFQRNAPDFCLVRLLLFLSFGFSKHKYTAIVCVRCTSAPVQFRTNFKHDSTTSKYYADLCLLLDLFISHEMIVINTHFQCTW